MPSKLLEIQAGHWLVRTSRRRVEVLRSIGICLFLTGCITQDLKINFGSLENPLERLSRAVDDERPSHCGWHPEAAGNKIKQRISQSSLLVFWISNLQASVPEINGGILTEAQKIGNTYGILLNRLGYGRRGFWCCVDKGAGKILENGSGSVLVTIKVKVLAAAQQEDHKSFFLFFAMWRLQSGN